MEWLGFIDAVFVALFVVFAPGLFAVRSCRFTWLASVVVAPVISAFLYVLIGLFAALLNISVSGVNLFICASCLSVGFYAISVLIYQAMQGKNVRLPVSNDFLKNRLSGKAEFISERLPDSLKPWLLLLMYIAIATVISCFVFLGGIESPATFSREFDASYHYTAIRSFLNNGIYSILDVRTFADIEASGGFYPAAWHIICAIVTSISGKELIVCANAVIFIGLSFVLPCGVFGLLSWLFPKKRLVVVFGSMCSLAFAGFPWGNLIFGQLVSNFYSNAMIPCTAMLLMVFFCSLKERSNRVLCGALLFVSFMGLAATQPNAVFSIGVFAVFYLLHFYCDCINESISIQNKVAYKVLGCILIILACCLIWALMFLVPLIQRVAVCNDFARYVVPESLLRCLVFSFSERLYPQFVIALFSWIGFFALAASKGRRWLCGPFLFSILLYVVSASCTGPLAFAVSGFWYNDIYRTAAMVCLFALPLAPYGLMVVARSAIFLFSRFLHGEKALIVFKAVFVTVLSAAFLYSNFILAIPYSDKAKENINAFARIQYFFHWFYSFDGSYIFNQDQYAFLQKAEEIISEDPGLIVNLPYDVSGWMYGVENIDTMYRTAWGPISSPLDSEAIRLRLNEFSRSKSVKKAVEELDAKYVLRLVPRNVTKKSNNDLLAIYYEADEWKGINRITDKTKGFKVLLKDGDMRLYKIER